MSVASGCKQAVQRANLDWKWFLFALNVRSHVEQLFIPSVTNEFSLYGHVRLKYLVWLVNAALGNGAGQAV